MYADLCEATIRRSTMPEHTTRAANAVQLDYHCRGAGPPLLFIHGLTFDRSTWDPVIDQVTDRFTCLAVDLPGHGGSTGPVPMLDDIAVAIQNLLDDLEIGPPVVVGHSMGGAIAGSYTAHHAVRGLVMVDQAPYVRPFAALLHQLEPALRSENFRSAFEPIRQTIGVELLPEPQRSSILAAQRIEQDLILGYWDELLRTTPDELQARIDRDLNVISVPVLAVFGQTIDAATREHLLAHVPTAKIEEWAGLGHMVHLMEPNRFARRLAEFATRSFATAPRP
jgi:pimeloyl-ACP methyl ester carboxylesterase